MKELWATAAEEDELMSDFHTIERFDSHYIPKFLDFFLISVAVLHNKNYNASLSVSATIVINSHMLLCFKYL